VALVLDDDDDDDAGVLIALVGVFELFACMLFELATVVVLLDISAFGG
jgi:hypothetical protein